MSENEILKIKNYLRKEKTRKRDKHIILEINNFIDNFYLDKNYYFEEVFSLFDSLSVDLDKRDLILLNPFLDKYNCFAGKEEKWSDIISKYKISDAYIVLDYITGHKNWSKKNSYNFIMYNLGSEKKENYLKYFFDNFLISERDIWEQKTLFSNAVSKMDHKAMKIILNNNSRISVNEKIDNISLLEKMTLSLAFSKDYQFVLFNGYLTKFDSKGEIASEIVKIKEQIIPFLFEYGYDFNQYVDIRPMEIRKAPLRTSLESFIVSGISEIIEPLLKAGSDMSYVYDNWEGRSNFYKDSHITDEIKNIILSYESKNDKENIKNNISSSVDLIKKKSPVL